MQEIKMADDFYNILGVSKTASKDEIKKAYRKLARKWHPDINPGNKEAEQKFKDISRAYDCLGNDERRKLYDEFGEEGLQAGFDAGKAREYKKWSGFQQAGQSQSSQGFGRYQSYEDVFGDLFEFGGRGGGFRTRTASVKGRDMEHEMTIDLISALKGFETELSMQKMEDCSACHGTGVDPAVKVTTCQACGGSGRINVAKGPMQFTRPCPQCGGHGQIGRPCPKCAGQGREPATEKIRVTIPKGVREGAKVRVAGKGEPGSDGGRPGDLYLRIHIRPHSTLKREGDNLYMDIPVTVGEVMAGASVTVPTLDGEVRLKIPAGSQSGQTLKLKGKGAPNMKTGRTGDLLVKLVVKVPQTDDREILEAAEKMNQFYKGDIRSGLKI